MHTFGLFLSGFPSPSLRLRFGSKISLLSLLPARRARLSLKFEYGFILASRSLLRGGEKLRDRSRSRWSRSGEYSLDRRLFSMCILFWLINASCCRNSSASRVSSIICDFFIVSSISWSKVKSKFSKWFKEIDFSI